MHMLHSRLRQLNNMETLGHHRLFHVVRRHTMLHLQVHRQVAGMRRRQQLNSSNISSSRSLRLTLCRHLKAAVDLHLQRMLMRPSRKASKISMHPLHRHMRQANRARSLSKIDRLPPLLKGHHQPRNLPRDPRPALIRRPRRSISIPLETGPTSPPMLNAW